MPKSFQKFLIFSFLGIFFLANISFGMMDFQKKDRNTGSTTFSPSSQNLQVSPLKVSDIKNELPKPEFLSLNFGEKISGEKEILVKIPSAQRVEFYLRSPSSLTEIYLGGGQIEKEDTWRFLLNSTNVPNGIYFLFLKVETSFGVYNTPEIQIEVFNEPQFQPEKIEEVKKEFEEKLEILSEKEKEIENIQEEIKENIKTELKENVEKKIEKEDLPSKEKIVSQIEKTKETIEKEIPIKLKELQKTVEKETKLPSPAIQEQIKKDKEEIKKEIIQDVITPIQQTTKEIPPEEKEKIEPVVSLLKERINNILNEGEIIIREKAKEKAKIDPKALLDSDEDGLYDWDEIRLGTDPFNPDSDRDGYLDGSEIKLKYDPLKPGPADKMVFQDPRKAGKVSEKISVEKVEFAKEDKIIRITGKGIPNSFVTIYIFSSPLIAMVKVNENGFWEYKLDKALSDGTHVVFAAYVNNRGEVEEKSSPLVFVKSGESIVRISEAPAALPPSPVVSLQKSFLVLVLGLMTLALGIAMFIISGLRLKEPK